MRRPTVKTTRSVGDRREQVIYQINSSLSLPPQTKKPPFGSFQCKLGALANGKRPAPLSIVTIPAARLRALGNPKS